MLPESLLIVGGGVIGVEFATLYSSLGVKVTVVEMLDRLLPMFDGDISAEISRIFKARNIDIHLMTKVTALEHDSDTVTAVLEGPESVQSVQAGKVLVSVGRRANVEGFGLERLGIDLHSNGIVVNSRMETTVPGVYAVGDVTGAWWLAHVASKEGVIAAENAAGSTGSMDYSVVPSCVFCSPEVASVGLSEAEAEKAGHSIRVGRFPMAANGKALTFGEDAGWVKVISDEKYGELLGVHIVGPHASDLILEGGISLAMEATLEEIISTIHAHPTLGETIAEAALAATGMELHS